MSFYIIMFFHHVHNIVIFDQLEFITDYFNQSGNRKKIMAEELFFKFEESFCKQDVEKQKLFAATIGINGDRKAEGI